MMNISNITDSELRYIRYSRKSSESKEKQALSIPDQNKECDEYKEKLGLNIAYKVQDEKSAFKPNRREGFNKLIELIKSGKANAVLTWKPDRICRNPLEGGVIMQLLQDGYLKEIRTPLGEVYTPDSDHLILQIHFGMANQYSRNLSQNVRRGLNRKILDRKEYPRPARIGFEGFGERGQRNIRPHPIEAPFILKAFQLAATGVYSYGRISEMLYEEGFRTKHGKKVTKSHIEYILHCPTYYGYFLWNGELHEGNFEPIISKALFDLVQEKLNDRSKPKNFAWVKEFMRLIRCGNCGCAITTTTKKKFIKKTKEWKYFTYHHCTHRRGDCNEKPVTDKDLKDLLYNLVAEAQIDKEVWQLGIKLVREKYKAEIDKNKNQHYYFSLEQQKIRDRIQKLIDMRANEELTKEEFLQQKNKLLEQLAGFENKLNDSNHSIKSWLELMEDFFNTAYEARDVVEHGSPEAKQRVLAKIGENFLLKNKMLTFSFKKPYDCLLKPEYRTDVLLSLDSNQNKRIQSPLSYR